MKKVGIIFLIIIFLIIVILLIVYSARFNIRGLKFRNDIETGLIVAASKYRDPAPCYKIGENSYDIWSWNPEGFQIAYYRSYCLLHIARMKGVDLCKDVRELKDMTHDGSGYSVDGCIAKVNSGGEPGSIGFSTRTLLDALGYNRNEGIIYVPEQKAEFMRRLENLPIQNQ